MRLIRVNLNGTVVPDAPPVTRPCEPAFSAIINDVLQLPDITCAIDEQGVYLVNNEICGVQTGYDPDNANTCWRWFGAPTICSARFRVAWRDWLTKHEEHFLHDPNLIALCARHVTAPEKGASHF